MSLFDFKSNLFSHIPDRQSMYEVMAEESAYVAFKILVLDIEYGTRRVRCDTYFLALKNSSAGHPRSFCLQFLHAS